MRPIILYAILAMLYVSTASSQDESEMEKIAASLQTHVKYLASDALEGRMAGKEGNYAAAEYILNTFKTMGITPVNGKYKQEFPFKTGAELNGENETHFTTILKRPGVPESMWRKIKRSWELGTDWYPMRFTKNVTVEGKLVFAGYGVTAPEKNYDDYAGIDAKDKIVIVLSDSSEDAAQREFLSEYRSLRYKAENAIKHGAKGIIYVKKQSDSANKWYRMKAEREPWNTEIAAIQANRSSIAKFFPRNYALYPLELEIEEKQQPKSFELQDVTVTITTNVKQTEKQIPNIFGMAAGADDSKKDRYIIVGAHFDHIGWGKDSSRHAGTFWDQGYKIHNGADDNASGVAGMIELAKLIKENPLPNPVIFAGFNAKEFETRGSEYFINNPPVDLKKIVFMLNLDMIGRMNYNKLNVLGASSSMMIDTLIDIVAENSPIKINRIYTEEVRGDHYNFYDENIPVLLLTTGMHRDYHKPGDDADKLHYGSEAKIVIFADELLRLISFQKDKPDFRKMLAPPEE